MAVEVGAKVSGKVTGITNFGAFVDLGAGKSGLVHISEISDGYVKDIHDVLSIGDEVTAVVTQIKDGKVGLSIRRADGKPHEEHSHHQGGHAHGPANHDRDHQAPRPQTHGASHSPRPKNAHAQQQKPALTGFDAMMSGFLKESEDRLSSLKRNTEGKRGGRGGRRS